MAKQLSDNEFRTSSVLSAEVRDRIKTVGTMVGIGNTNILEVLALGMTDDELVTALQKGLPVFQAHGGLTLKEVEKQRLNLMRDAKLKRSDLIKKIGELPQEKLKELGLQV